MVNRWPDFYSNFTQLVPSARSFLHNEISFSRIRVRTRTHENLVELLGDLDACIEQLDAHAVTIYTIDVLTHTHTHTHSSSKVNNSRIMYRGNLSRLCKLSLLCYGTCAENVWTTSISPSFPRFGTRILQTSLYRFWNINFIVLCILL